MQLIQINLILSPSARQQQQYGKSMGLNSPKTQLPPLRAVFPVQVTASVNQAALRTGVRHYANASGTGFKQETAVSRGVWEPRTNRPVGPARPRVVPETTDGK